MKKYLFGVLLLSSLGIHLVSAHTADTSDVKKAELVSVIDLGVEDPGLLPTNPFYFMKEWSRGIRRIFTRNSFDKTILELRISNEKAAEVKKVQELNPENTGAITDALQNYEDTQHRLQDQIQLLDTTSQNPNIDQLLEQFTNQAIRHEKVFEAIGDRFADDQEVKDLINSIKDKVDESISVASEKDNTQDFALKLEKAFKETEVGQFSDERSKDIIDRIKEKSSDALKLSLDKIKDGIDVEIKDNEDAHQASTTKKIEPPKKESIICTKEYKPVCGVNDKVYGNACEAKTAGVAIKYTGKCELSPESKPALLPLKEALPAVCTEQYDPVCGINGKTYANECQIRKAQVNVKYFGECDDTDFPNMIDESEGSTTVATSSASVASTTSLQQEDTLRNASILIGEDGTFTPQTVKIRKGGKITWINKGNRFVWPASDPHPTHDLYPGFDAGRGISNGEAYSFVFEKVGKWSYHDHLNTGMKGMVEVVE